MCECVWSHCLSYIAIQIHTRDVNRNTYKAKTIIFFFLYLCLCFFFCIIGSLRKSFNNRITENTGENVQENKFNRSNLQFKKKKKTQPGLDDDLRVNIRMQTQGKPYYVYVASEISLNIMMLRCRRQHIFLIHFIWFSRLKRAWYNDLALSIYLC